MREAQRQRVLARWAAKRERHRRKRQGVCYQPWRHQMLRRDQQEVAQRLAGGRIDLVTVSGWGFVASFLAFLDEVPFFALLDLAGTGFQRVMIPIARLLLSYQLKVLLGIGAINLVPSTLFREIALLRLIGYTTSQLRAGFCQRGNLAVGPMHKNTLADAIERLSAVELETLLNRTAQRLAQRGFLAQSNGHFALDASDLPTTRRYVGAGCKSVTKRVRTKTKAVVEVERPVWGFKVLIVYEVRLRLVVAAKVVPIQEHESQHTRALVRQAIANLGPGVLRVLLIDRGFLDGQDLWVLKHDWGIDFVVPAKDTMRVTADARALCRRAGDGASIFSARRAGRRTVRRDGTVCWPGQVALVGVGDLRSYDQYGDADHVARANRTDFVGHSLQAVVVTEWAGQEYPRGEEPVFLSSLPVGQPLRVLDLYDLRSLIENTAFRELKQGWCLENYPKKTAAAVRGHVLLTLVTFTLANAFRTAQGQKLAGHGVRRLRAELSSPQVVVFADECYAFFDIEEVLILLGVVPQSCLRADPAQVRRRYDLAGA